MLLLNNWGQPCSPYLREVLFEENGQNTGCNFQFFNKNILVSFGLVCMINQKGLAEDLATLVCCGSQTHMFPWKKSGLWVTLSWGECSSGCGID